ncbi:MAG: zinc-finger domain-containing protein [Devosiaceae bacterium]|nr:zinc-finger domain-containing protein [Devosiaceae bacterium]
MSSNSTPHFHNTQGVSRIEIGAREFMCVGALPPFDHPHIFLDMGSEGEIVCPYCSTHYVFNPKLTTGTSDPASAVYTPKTA